MVRGRRAALVLRVMVVELLHQVVEDLRLVEAAALPNGASLAARRRGRLRAPRAGERERPLDGEPPRARAALPAGLVEAARVAGCAGPPRPVGDAPRAP